MILYLLSIAKFLSNWGLSSWFYCSYILCDACPCMTLLLINSSLHDKCILRLIIYCVKEKGELRNIFVLAFSFINKRFSEKGKSKTFNDYLYLEGSLRIMNDMNKIFPSIHNIALSSKFMFKVLWWNLITHIVKDQRFI